MANKEQLAILKQGVAAWNKWREEHPDAKIDLRWAKLDGLDLSGANFHGANIYGASFINCYLAKANFNKSKIGNSLYDTAIFIHGIPFVLSIIYIAIKNLCYYFDLITYKIGIAEIISAYSFIVFRI